MPSNFTHTHSSAFGRSTNSTLHPWREISYAFTRQVFCPARLSVTSPQTVIRSLSRGSGSLSLFWPILDARLLVPCVAHCFGGILFAAAHWQLLAYTGCWPPSRPKSSIPERPAYEGRDIQRQLAQNRLNGESAAATDFTLSPFLEGKCFAAVALWLPTDMAPPHFIGPGT